MRSPSRKGLREEHRHGNHFMHQIPCLNCNSNHLGFQLLSWRCKEERVDASSEHFQSYFFVSCFRQIFCRQCTSSEALLCVHYDRNDLHLHRCGLNSKYLSHKHQTQIWKMQLFHIPVSVIKGRTHVGSTCVKGAGLVLYHSRHAAQLLSHVNCNLDFIRILFVNKCMGYWHVFLFFLAIDECRVWIESLCPWALQRGLTRTPQLQSHDT